MESRWLLNRGRKTCENAGLTPDIGHKDLWYRIKEKVSGLYFTVISFTPNLKYRQCSGLVADTDRASGTGV